MIHRSGKTSQTEGTDGVSCVIVLVSTSIRGLVKCGFSGFMPRGQARDSGEVGAALGLLNVGGVKGQASNSPATSWFANVSQQLQERTTNEYLACLGRREQVTCPVTTVPQRCTGHTHLHMHPHASPPCLPEVNQLLLPACPVDLWQFPPVRYSCGK